MRSRIQMNSKGKVLSIIPTWASATSQVLVKQSYTKESSSADDFNFFFWLNIPFPRSYCVKSFRTRKDE